MTDPWNLTEAQRLQFREAHAEAKRKQMAATMSNWGTLTDYTTGQPIRPATAGEWERTRDMVLSDSAGGETGAWTDDDGRAVYVDGGPEIATADRLTAAQAELEELAAQSREAYRRWQELDRQVTAKADEIRELKRKIRLA